MRIADKMQFEQVKGNMGKNRSDLSNLQNQAAIQKRVTKPSDDPLAATRVLSNRADVQMNEQYTKNATLAKSFLEQADQSLGELSEVLIRAKELAIAQSNDASSNSTSRRVTATEIDQLFSQSVQIGNRKLGDRFLFAGYKTNAAPFNETGEYRGDDGEILIQVNKEAHVAMNVPGNRVFLGDGFSKDGVFKSARKAPESVDELKKQRREERERLELEQQRKLEQPETLDVRGPAANVVPGGDEVPDSEIPLITPSKGLSVFDVLNDLSAGLKTDHKATIQESIDRLDDVLAQVILARSQIGARVATIDNVTNALSRAVMDAKVSSSQLEDVDTVALVSDISKQQSTLQATLQTSGKLIQPSLLDFLR
jgi:flagellar hook-associated protein 3 FlgL